MFLPNVLQGFWLGGGKGSEGDVVLNLKGGRGPPVEFFNSSRVFILTIIRVGKCPSYKTNAPRYLRRVLRWILLGGSVWNFSSVLFYINGILNGLGML